LPLALGALGVVFGDIGTSPLYALRECFSAEYGLTLTPENIMGILSLIFWTLFFTISVKYMAFFMRADNRGEGGILSLMALATRSLPENTVRRKIVMVTLGLIGAALLYGDGVITPAITVLSAIEGLNYVTPAFESMVVLITLAVMLVLFLGQRVGTARIGFFFGPILLIWFFVLAWLGITNIAQNTAILKAFNPWHAVEFFVRNQGQGYFVLGSVFLVVTGGEALYADMGHFGKRPIRLAWFWIAFPALIINYFGQGALLLQNSEAISNPFYLMAPNWSLIPLIILSTLASIIASQALITGVYSLTRQAIQLGYCPRLSIIHTSSKEIGQIYIPFVNWLLFGGVSWLVITFKTSSSLAAAYGIAVTLTMVITTILAHQVAVHLWKWSKSKASLLFGIFLMIDLAFLTTNVIKIEHGGWVPLIIGFWIYILMTTWQKGRAILYRRLRERTIPLEQFCDNVTQSHPIRVPGTAIYMSADSIGTPIPLLHNLKHNKVLHERVAILNISTQEVPFVSKIDRVKIDTLMTDFYRIQVFYGFMETPKMKHILDACRVQGVHFNVTETTFVLGRETILVSQAPEMLGILERLFILMARNAARPTAFFKIPPNQVIEVGIQVEI